MTDIEFQVDDLVQLRKPHACQTNCWRIYRIGADVGLHCQGCGFRQLMPINKFKKALKRKVASCPPSNTKK